MPVRKDFQDKRKSCDITMALTETDVNLPRNQHKKTVNNYKNSTLNCCETIENTQEINNEVLPNESVPIGILTHNDMSDSDGVNNVPEALGKLNQQNNTNCSDVPFSNNEAIYNGSKNYIKENSCSKLNAKASSSNTKDNDENGSKSNLHQSRVPNMTGIKAKEDVHDASINFNDEFYYTEEPPDLHVIDDSKVKVEDFHYYDSYDEPDIQTHHDEYDIADNVAGEINTIREDVVNISAEPSVNDTAENSTNDNSSISIDKSSDINNMTVIQISAEIQETFYTQNSVSNCLGSTNSIITDSQNNWEDEINDQYPLSDPEEECKTKSQENNVKLNSEVNIKETIERDSITIVKEELNSITSQNLDKDPHNLENNETFLIEKCNPTLNENNFQLKETHQETNFIKDNSKLDEVDNFSDFNNFLNSSARDKNNIEIEAEATPTKFDDFACFDDATFSEYSTNYIDNTNTTYDSKDVNIIEEDEEFGDFGDYTQSDSRNVQSTPVTVVNINKEEILKNVDRIVSEMYPAFDVSYNDFVLVDVLKTDSVFKNAQDVTETNALMYQWTKSTSQDRLLKALNIDTRNIVSIIDVVTNLSNIVYCF